MGEDPIEEQNDASSNPNAEEYLPTAGEYRTAHVSEDGTITEIDDDETNELDDYKTSDPNSSISPTPTADKSY